ncbi:MAG: hypothetical protein V4747_13875 [Pseudomonadota bacterium]
MRIAQMPCLWLADDPVDPAVTYRITRYFPAHVHLQTQDMAGRQAWLAQQTADHVLVLTDRTIPHSSLPDVTIDPLLLQTGGVIGLLGRSTITGAVVDGGPCIFPAARLVDLSPSHRDVLVPQVVADWLGNRSPEDAFRQGFAAQPDVIPDDTAARDLLALHASVGADAAYGVWWLLGTASALLGRQSVDAAWRSDGGLDTPDAVQQRLAGLARQVRVTHAIDFYPMDPDQSRLFKAIAPTWPPARYFQDIAAYYDAHAGGSALAARYRRAALAIWGFGPDATRAASF